MKSIEFSVRVICPSAVSLLITEYCTKHELKAETHKTSKLPKDEWEVVITIPKNSDGLFVSDIQKIITTYEDNVEKFKSLCYYLNNMFYSTSYETDVATFKLLICSPSIQIPYEKGKRFNLKMLIDILKSTTYSKDGFYKMLKEYYPKLSEVDLLNIADTHYNLLANHILMLEKFLLGGKI
jgi:hypothetical protein